jgi:molybdopterin synthase catalytic subunit
VGRLEIGDAAVAVAAAAAHREEAFVACRHVIEELKRRVPIWKREVFADGTVEWVGEQGKQVSGEAGKRVSEEVSQASHELASRGVGGST